MNQAVRIKMLMLRQGVTVGQLAAELGVWPSYVTRTIDGSRRFPRVRAHIAGRLGYPVEELFQGKGENPRRTRMGTANGHE